MKKLFTILAYLAFFPLITQAYYSIPGKKEVMGTKGEEISVHYKIGTTGGYPPNAIVTIEKIQMLLPGQVTQLPKAGSFTFTTFGTQGPNRLNAFCRSQDGDTICETVDMGQPVVIELGRAGGGEKDVQMHVHLGSQRVLDSWDGKPYFILNNFWPY
jgi:hypothetical protein